MNECREESTKKRSNKTYPVKKKTHIKNDKNNNNINKKRNKQTNNKEIKQTKEKNVHKPSLHLLKPI